MPALYRSRKPLEPHRRNGRTTIPFVALLAFCMLVRPAQANDGGEKTLSTWTSIYQFLADKSTITQTGGIAGVHWIYAVEGRFILAVDTEAGTASFDHVDANAVDDSHDRHTLDPNEVFNMTDLAGTIVDGSDSIRFEGMADDGSSVQITLTFADDTVALEGQTTPPPNSADFFLFALDAAAQRKYSGGTGEPDDPYQIATAEDLMLLGETPEDYDKHFILTADIDLDPNLPGRKVFDKAVIAPTKSIFQEGRIFLSGTPFSGIFNGNGHVITHMTLMHGSFLGLFGRLGSGSIVTDLGIVDANVVGSEVGGLAGVNSGEVTGCYTTGTVIGASSVGGLVATNGATGTVVQCYTRAAVSGTSAIGGIVGHNNGTVTRCCSTSSVSGSYSVGGIVGNNGMYLTGGTVTGGTVTHCYSTGTVSGSGYVGGLVGNNNYGTLIKCYSSGAVSGDSTVGGLIGTGDPTHVIHGVWDVENSGQPGSAGGVGLTTAEMMDPYMLGLNGFADDPNWVLNAGRDYSRLAWEGTTGQTIPEPRIHWLEGGGMAESPYSIDTADQLILLGKASILWDKHFILTDDIDLDLFLPAGQVFAQAPIPVFMGVLDGNGHTISHLMVAGDSYLGLLGRLESGAEVKSLGAVDVNIVGMGDYVGGLVGLNDGTVTNCYSTGVVSGSESVGGLVGENWHNVIRCFGTSTVGGSGNNAGGLLGYNCGIVTESNSTGAVNSLWCVGGLVGRNDAVLTHCYSTGTVSGKDYIGGLAGLSQGTITRCYSTGAASGSDYVGGLVGAGGAGTTASFWDIQTSGQTTSAGGIGKTTAEMLTASTFLEAGWDFVGEMVNGTDDIWWILEGQDYPRLWWEAE